MVESLSLKPVLPILDILQRSIHCMPPGFCQVNMSKRLEEVHYHMTICSLHFTRLYYVGIASSMIVNSSIKKHVSRPLISG